MTTTTLPSIKKVSQSKSIWHNLGLRLVYGLDMLRTWQRRHQARHDLRCLNGWLREDIGLRRVDVGWEANTAFWQP